MKTTGALRGAFWGSMLVFEGVYELWSKLLVSPFITLIILTYRIPYIAHLRSLDYSAYDFVEATTKQAFT